MSLSPSLINDFIKVTSTKKEKKESTVYATVVVQGDAQYAKFDGTELLTPIETTVNLKDGDRVLVTIRNHTAIVTGSTSSPAASNYDLSLMDQKLLEVDKIVANKAEFDDLVAETARIDDLIAKNVEVTGKLTVNEADIKDLKTENVEISGKLTANEAAIKNLTAENVEITGKLTANEADIKDLLAQDVEIYGRLTANEASIVNLEATNVEVTGKLTANEADIKDLKAENVEITGKLDAAEADIKDLEAKKLSAEEAEIKYANIDFSNIGKAAMEYLYATSGLIKDVTVGDATIAGELVGVTIKGDLIEGGTIVAEKLVIKGEDGLFYKLNTDGVSIETEQTEYNSLNGKNILANSITATKIDVEDLVAFDATIAGFNITDDAIYSGVKESVTNTTRGIYMDKSGQISFGDSENYLRYYKQADGSYRLEISAESIVFRLNGANKNIEQVVEDLKEEVEEASRTATNHMALGGEYGEGLVIADLTGDTLGRNIHIQSDGIDLRSGQTVLATFQEDLIELGNSSDNAKIILCGAGEITNRKVGMFTTLTLGSRQLDLEGYSIHLHTSSEIYKDAYDPVYDPVYTGLNLVGNSVNGQAELYVTHHETDSSIVIAGYASANPSIELTVGKSDTYKGIELMLDKCTVGTDLYIDGDLHMKNGKYIYNKFADGSDAIMVAMNGSDQQLFGYSGYQSGVGETYFDGNKVYIRSNSTILLNGYNVPTMSYENGYWGLGFPVGQTTPTYEYIRTPLDGILPYQSGSHGNVGTSGWPFKNGYFTNLFKGGTSVSIEGHNHTGLYNNTANSNVIQTYSLSSSVKCVDPVADNFEVTLGRNTTGKRYKCIYLTSSPSVSSDMRLKEEFNTDMTKYVEMMDLIEPTSYLRKDDSDTERKRNVGYIAQKVWKALKTVGLEEKDFAGFIKDIQDEGSVYSYALSYEQFIPILHARQDRDKAELLERITRIEKALGISDAS